MQQAIEPRGQSAGFGCEHGRGHDTHVVCNFPDDQRGAGHVALFPDHARSSNEAVELRIVDAAGHAFFPQRCRRLVEMLGVG
jgi:dienelactone hydrolase